MDSSIFCVLSLTGLVLCLVLCLRLEDDRGWWWTMECCLPALNSGWYWKANIGNNDNVKVVKLWNLKPSTGHKSGGKHSNWRKMIQNTKFTVCNASICLCFVNCKNKSLGRKINWINNTKKYEHYPTCYKNSFSAMFNVG